MPADIINVADYVVSTLNTHFTSNSISSTAVRVWDIEKDLGKTNGLKVQIFPEEYSTDRHVTRKESEYNFQVNIIIGERYTIVGSQPPTSWLDEHVLLVQNNILEVFNIRTIIPISGESYWIVGREVPVVYSRVLYRKHKWFWSEVILRFRRLK